MTYFCSFSGSWLQTREFFICWKCNLQNTFKIETVADFCVHSSDISGNVKYMKTNLNFCYPVSTSSCVQGSSLPLKSFSINLFILLPQQRSFSHFSDILTVSCKILLLQLPWNTSFSGQDTITSSGQWMFKVITELTLITFSFQVHCIYTGNIPVPCQYLTFNHFK